MLNLMNYSEIRKFFYLSFFNSSDLGFENKKVFLFYFLVDILHLGSGSMDLHIFADPDPRSQNLTDPTDPDSKHCFLYDYFNI